VKKEEGVSRNYWKSIEERERGPASQAGQPPGSQGPAGEGHAEPGDREHGGHEPSRRSFLRAAGFSIAGTMLASCTRGMVEKAIPQLVKPEEITPGRAYWYATSCGGCNAGCGLLVKNRDGRPIKIEGNSAHPLSKGGVCCVGQATVLGLYDSHRLRKPLLDGVASEWPKVDEALKSELARISDSVYFLTGTVTSVTTRALIGEFLSKFQGSAHIEHDAVSYAAILDAHEETFERRSLPHYRFEKADLIVSFDADFLGTWISPVEFTKAYVSARAVDGERPRLSRHIQFEGRMSLTGSNADLRVKVTPAECRFAILKLAEELAEMDKKASPPWTGDGESMIDGKIIREIADDLWKAKGKCLVVCGLNDVESQRAVNFINHTLGNYGETLDITAPSLQWNGNDRAMKELVRKIKSGEVKALFMADVNPAYSLPNARELIDGLKKVPLTVCFTEHLHETAELSRYVCPLPHYLESWNDAEIAPGLINVSQPAISATGDTRSMREALAAWMKTPRPDLEILQSYWREKIFPRQGAEASFQRFWDKAVENGFTIVAPKPVSVSSFRLGPDPRRGTLKSTAAGQYEAVLYETVNMRDGRHAYNPWLQELPDPVTKAVWDNYVSLAPALAKKLKVEEGDLVNVCSEEVSLELPALLQPGQHERVVAIAVGYGRKGTDRFSLVGPQWLQAEPTVKQGESIGKNAFALADLTGNGLLLERTVSILPTGKRGRLALTQMHHTITVPEHLGGQRRDLVRETTLAAFLKDPASGNRYEGELLQLWPDDHKHEGHRWGMAIDLNRCTGCSACIIGCQAENNIPVVGKDEVARHREMHWIRLDRYYSGDDGQVDVLHLPVMCQHCDHAPCETVCPVLATVHSEEGLNQQVYNRCVGTRYCANNCPYKVRRFNWFNYRQEDQEENLVLNPDVTTRSRGVMEKCSLCVQRVQEAKAEAKRRGLPLSDGDIKTACQQSCPAEAIVFGDLNDPGSQVARLAKSPRHYHLLEEMNFMPAVGYLTKIRHRGGSS
jgi:molybdopterin-containing oxidoreductase family iron-sulfur binding subunit